MRSSWSVSSSTRSVSSTCPAGRPLATASRTSEPLADRNRDMFRAGMKRCDDRPCRNTARLMCKPCAAMERMTRSPVSGSLRDRMMTSTSGSRGSARSFSDSRRRTKGKATLVQDVVHVGLLVPPVRVLTLLPEHRVAVGEVEQGAGGDPDDDTVGQVVLHLAPAGTRAHRHGYRLFEYAENMCAPCSVTSCAPGARVSSAPPNNGRWPSFSGTPSRLRVPSGCQGSIPRRGSS